MGLRLFYATFLIFLLHRGSVSTIPSDGTNTADQIRMGFGKKAFKISLENGQKVITGDFETRIPVLAKTPVLAALDVQMTFADAIIKPRKSFFRHYHPRSSETIFVSQGPLLVEFEFEGLVKKTVRNILGTGEFTVIPQGLIHQIFCRSSVSCRFVAVFRSADPGIVPVNRS